MAPILELSPLPPGAVQLVWLNGQKVPEAVIIPPPPPLQKNLLLLIQTLRILLKCRCVYFSLTSSETKPDLTNGTSSEKLLVTASAAAAAAVVMTESPKIRHDGKQT